MRGARDPEMSYPAVRLSDMTDNSPKPPVIVEVHLQWPSFENIQHEIARVSWDAMTPAQRSTYCDLLAEEDASDRFGQGWSIADPADYAATEETT